MKGYDLIVVGLGAHGSSILFHAAKRGLRVLGIEQYDVGHKLGSSHGVHRIFRIEHAKDALYVPMLLRAAELWRDLEMAVGDRILYRVGVLSGSPDCSGRFDAEYQCIKAFGIGHRVLTADQINARYPAFVMAPDMVGLLQTDAGYLLSEQAIAAHISLAVSQRANVVTQCNVLGLRERGDHMEVNITMGTFEAGQVAVATGAFIGHSIPQVAKLHRVSRRVQGFFLPDRPASYASDVCPCFIFSNDRIGIYGFPMHGSHGIKIGRDGHRNESCDPYTLRRNTSLADEICLRTGVREFLSDGNARLQRMQTCILNETPDRTFIIDRLHEMPRVHIVSMCSGQGFKFSSLTGEVIVDRVQGKTDRFDLTKFKLDRFTTSEGH